MSADNYGLVLKINEKYYVYDSLSASSAYDLEDFVTFLPIGICDTKLEALNKASEEYTEYGTSFIDYDEELKKDVDDSGIYFGMRKVI